MQHARGVDADQVEECGPHEVEQDGGEGDAPVDAHPLVFGQVADGADVTATGLKDRDVGDDITVRPDREVEI